MKAAQHLSDLRQMEISDLDARLKEVRTELFNLRFQAATGQLENHRQIRAVRHQIAQVLTVIQGRQLGLEERVEQAPDAAVAPRAKARIEHGRDVGAGTADADATAEPAPAEAEVTDAATGDVNLAEADSTVADEPDEEESK